MITFIPGDWLFQGTLIYLPSELSFDTINRKIAGVASVLVNDINIEFSENREAVAVWGLCPLSSWNRGSVPEPSFQFTRSRPLHRDAALQYQDDKRRSRASPAKSDAELLLVRRPHRHHGFAFRAHDD